MNHDDKVTLGILGGSIAASLAIALLILLTAGCACMGCKANAPIVHPTDEQIENGTRGGESVEPPYVPWWAES